MISELIPCNTAAIELTHSNTDTLHYTYFASTAPKQHRRHMMVKRKKSYAKKITIATTPMKAAATNDTHNFCCWTIFRATNTKCVQYAAKVAQKSIARIFAPWKNMVDTGISQKSRFYQKWSTKSAMQSNRIWRRAHIQYSDRTRRIKDSITM